MIRFTIARDAFATMSEDDLSAKLAQQLRDAGIPVTDDVKLTVPGTLSAELSLDGMSMTFTWEPQAQRSAADPVKAA